MFVFVPVISLPTQLTRVKTELSFVAEDPWNGNRPCSFTLDNYMLTLRGTKSVPRKAQEASWVGGFHRAVCSEIDGITRFLPESLIELWLRRQVSTEALPALLKQLEPGLKKRDYKPILRSLSMKIFGLFEAICCTALVLIAIIGVVLGHAPLWLAAMIVAGTASVCWIFFYQVYFGMLLRRKRQMRWLLERIANGIPATAAHPDRVLKKQNSQLTTPATTLPQPPQPTRKFVSSIIPAHADALALLSKLRAAFPELAWQGGERTSGSIHLAGESREEPSKVGVHLLCQNPPGPFTLTIRLHPADTASAEAEALKARVTKALVAAMTPPPQPPGPFAPPPPPLISPQPMSLQTVVLRTTLEGKEIQLFRIAKDPSPTSPEIAEPKPTADFKFESTITVPEVMEPAMQPRLRKEFPELAWDDRAESFGKVRIEGASRQTPQRVVISIVRNESAGTFKLWITVSAPDQSEAVKSLKNIIERIKSALLGWSQFHLPQFKTRPPTGIDIDQEEIVHLVFPLERGEIRLLQANPVILISRILLEALSIHGEILDNRAKNPEKYPGSDNSEGRAARSRGAAARLILGQAVPSGSGKDLDVELSLVLEAHSLVGELLENGLAQVIPYRPGGSRAPAAPSTSPRRIKVHYFGRRTSQTGGFGYISYSGAEGDAGTMGEFFRLDWWSSRARYDSNRTNTSRLSQRLSYRPRSQRNSVPPKH